MLRKLYLNTKYLVLLEPYDSFVCCHSYQCYPKTGAQMTRLFATNYLAGEPLEACRVAVEGEYICTVAVEGEYIQRVAVKGEYIQRVGSSFTFGKIKHKHAHETDLLYQLILRTPITNTNEVQTRKANVMCLPLTRRFDLYLIMTFLLPLRH